MAAIKHTLQREVFLPSEEQLLSVVHVTKPGKKKKSSFLCVSVTTDTPVQVMIYQVKKSDRDAYKKKLSWSVRELKSVDGKCNGNKDTGEFDLVFERTYKWIASNTGEKNSFLQYLYKLGQKYTVSKPKFINVPKMVLEDTSQEVEKTMQQADAIVGTTEWEYQALTSQEEEDLETVMSQVDDAIGNAEAFVEQLSKDLSVLDGANVRSIMGSEDQVLELMALIDKGLSEACKIEDKLDYYYKEIEGVKELMEITKEKEQQLQGRSRNYHALMQELNSLVSSLDLSQEDITVLSTADLSTPKGVQRVAAASKVLLKCLSANIHPALKDMTAVKEQQKKLATVKATFTKNIGQYLNNLFIHQSTLFLGGYLSRGDEASDKSGGDLKLMAHKQIHRNLMPHADIILFLRESDREKFDKLAKVYLQSISKLYDGEIKNFFQTIKARLQHGKPIRDSSNWFVPSAMTDRKSGSTSSLNKDPKSGTSDIDISEQTKFDQLLEFTFKELAPVCSAEQDFCVKFFHLSVTVEDEASPVLTADDASSPSEFKQKKIHEELRRMMTELFPCLESELLEFVNFGHRIDSFNSLYMLVRLGPMVMTSEDTNSFLIKVLGSCLVQIRKHFASYVQNQVQLIKESKPSKKSKVGILPFVHRFEEFAQRAETIFKGVERRTELDKAYSELLNIIIQEVLRLSVESPKVPSEVIVLENCHRLVSVLSQQHIVCLENQKRDIRQLYQEQLQKYVISQLGRPMEKLNVFFEGIQSKVAGGVKEEEVGYQLAYSKQELRKTIKEYPAKEVKKGIDQLYKKVEKHLSEEENLLQVVWHSFQDEFLKQYKHFDQLIARCYPGSGITLEFNINDVLAFFQDIALSH